MGDLVGGAILFGERGRVSATNDSSGTALCGGYDMVQQVLGSCREVRELKDAGRSVYVSS